MVDALVIGVGNTLRGDDGVGRALVEQIAGDPRAAAVRVLSRVQLTPELAFDLASARHVVFVDATSQTPPGEISMRHVCPGNGQTMTHHMSPEALLGLAGALYGVAPEAVLVSVGIESTGLDGDLSPAVRAALPAARERVLAYLESVAAA